VRNEDWVAEILDEREQQSFAWQSQEGSDCAGLITFHKLSDRLTRIELNLDVVPTGVAETIQLATHRADAKAERDLRRFKARLELINPDLYEPEEEPDAEAEAEPETEGEAGADEEPGDADEPEMDGDAEDEDLEDEPEDVEDEDFDDEEDLDDDEEDLDDDEEDLDDDDEDFDDNEELDDDLEDDEQLEHEEAA
jgi:hypothetical protein